MTETFSIAANGEDDIALQRQAYMFCLIAMLTRLKMFKSTESGIPKIISVSENWTMNARSILCKFLYMVPYDSTVITLK